MKALNPGIGSSLVVQWLRLQASTAGGMGSIPGWGTKILHAMQYARPPKKRRVLGLQEHPKLAIPVNLIHPLVCVLSPISFLKYLLFGCAGS